jgi:hypothetical protein
MIKRHQIFVPRDIKCRGTFFRLPNSGRGRILFRLCQPGFPYSQQAGLTIVSSRFIRGQHLRHNITRHRSLRTLHHIDHRAAIPNQTLSQALSVLLSQLPNHHPRPLPSHRVNAPSQCLPASPAEAVHPSSTGCTDSMSQAKRRRLATQ